MKFDRQTAMKEDIGNKEVSDNEKNMSDLCTCMKELKMAVSRGEGMLQSACDLPDENIVCILLHLPVKTLMRCKAVSKSWNALITDPYFVHQHHSQQPSSKLLMAENLAEDGIKRVYPLPLTFDTSSKQLLAHPNVNKPFEPYFLDDMDIVMWLMGPCFGVFCYGVVNRYREWSARMTLRNIATGEEKVLPYLHCGKEDRVNSYQFGFGCVRSNNSIGGVPEFKLVRLTYLSPEVDDGEFEYLAHVYTSATNSWKSIEACHSFALSRGIEVNGVIHWVAKRLEAGPEYLTNNFILTFDLQKEIFGRIEIPHGTYNINCDLLTKQEDKYMSLISRSRYYNSGDYIDIWIHIGESWVRQTRIVDYSGEVLLGYWQSVGGLLSKVDDIYGGDMGGIVITTEGNRHKRCLQFLIGTLFDYVESIVSFNF